MNPKIQTRSGDQELTELVMRAGFLDTAGREKLLTEVKNLSPEKVLVLKENLKDTVEKWSEFEKEFTTTETEIFSVFECKTKELKTKAKRTMREAEEFNDRTADEAELAAMDQQISSLSPEE